MLNPQILQIEIERAVYESANRTYVEPPDPGTREFARRLSIAITNYIKTATVIVQYGSVTLTGTIE